MKITCMLVFWDEPAKVLYEWAKSMGQLADHIVAADGPFALYPHDEVASDPIALAAIREGAKDGGAELTLLEGREWEGQVDKRNTVAQACGPTDWVFWSDADERITTCDRKAVRQALEDTAAEAVHAYRTVPPNPDARWKVDSFPAEAEGQTTILPRIFRYYDGINVIRAHWCWVGNRDGTPIYYWGMADGHHAARVGELPVETLHFSHLQTWRSDAYRKRQLLYRANVAVQIQDEGAES